MGGVCARDGGETCYAWGWPLEGVSIDRESGAKKGFDQTYLIVAFAILGFRIQSSVLISL
jgi:hypothetical protein